ncbi:MULTISPECIES: amino acid ABC transporter substrate-binding protein [unclassified Achromobacter]|uniref:amino acid ABC transporter substrate-binding protein n=1 Tax=unclassified Achromobacter TaxID=2626865 RepID=UPI000B5169A5|nr:MULTISPECIES: amino acid ABC transporter substrate-binding protein [unclassified Achromobacter]OWT69072.1 amino acid ABC transporter substrate-binding protein [Achromobacter sp. HZ34]OWT70477.1 amino acid ABC transporter substrate-binding protein [Achromobacter sp. HZ28]
MRKFLSTALAAGLLCVAGAAHAGTTFDNVKKKGFVQCGFAGIPGFSVLDSKGEWTGIDVDMCRAVAAAMFGDASKVKGNVLTAQAKFTALQSGEIDMLSRNTTLTLARDTTLGLIGVGVNFYDAQGVLVKKSLGAKSIKDLDGATICVQPGTTTELNLADYFRANKISFKPVLVENYDENFRLLETGRCDAYTNDKSNTAANMRTRLAKPDEWEILPENLSKEPLGPMVRQGDEQWFNLLRWTLNVMLEAEEYGITSKNVDDMLKSTNPNVQRILGVTPGMGKNLGVDDKWAYNIIKQVGNYGESYDRAMGKDSPLKLERGLNRLWTQGGLMYGWPVR